MANSLLSGLPPTHPGEVLRQDVLPSLGLSQAKIAEHLGVSRQTLNALLQERQPVTTAMALRLGKLLGSAPEFWMKLQLQYDLHTQAIAMAYQEFLIAKDECPGLMIYRDIQLLFKIAAHPHIMIAGKKINRDTLIR